MPIPPTRYIDAGPGVPLANPQTAMMTGDAMARFGETIQHVGAIGFQVAEKVRKIEEAGKMSAFFSNLNEEASQFSNSLMTRSDTGAWPSDWKEKTTDMRERMKSLGLSPEGMAAADREFGEWATQRTIHFETQAASKALDMGRAQIGNSMKYNISRLDKDGLERDLRIGRASGTINQVEEDHVRQQFDQADFEQTLTDRIKDDPRGAATELKDTRAFLEKNPQATVEMVERAQRMADHAVNGFQSDFLNDMIVEGHDPSEKELSEWEQQGIIDKSTHAQILTRKRLVGPVNVDPEIYGQTYDQIMSYDKATDPNRLKEAQLRAWIGSRNLPDDTIRKLNSTLTDRLSPAAQNSVKGRLESDFAKKIQTDFTRGDWGKYRLPVDDDNDPTTPPIMPINKEEYDKAWKARGEFTNEWRGILQTLPDDAPFSEVQKQYEALKESHKAKKPLPDLKINKTKPMPFDEDALYKATSGGPATFGDQPIKSPGEVYSGVVPTVFGGKNDPADNGKSAFGGTTGKGGREGVAIPQALLEAKFPAAVKKGKADALSDESKQWVDSNVRAVVWNGGVPHVLPVADLGTAERVWKDNGRPTLDLTEGAVEKIGGKVERTKGGIMAGVKGAEALQFAVVSIDTGKPLAKQTWEDAKAGWFRQNKAKSFSAVHNSMVALKAAWSEAHAGSDELGLPLGDSTAQASLLPPKP